MLLSSTNFRLANIIKTILTSEDRYKNLTKLKHVFIKNMQYENNQSADKRLSKSVQYMD